MGCAHGIGSGVGIEGKITALSCVWFSFLRRGEVVVVVVGAAGKK